MPCLVTHNAAVQRPRAALSSAQQAHNEVAHLRRARDAVSPSAATALLGVTASLLKALGECIARFSSENEKLTLRDPHDIYVLLRCLVSE